MTYTISEQKEVKVLEINRLLNEYENKVILDEVDECIQSGKRDFIIDLAHLEFMNSVGINFLISMMKKSKVSGGHLALVNAPNQVVKLLEITKLKTMFQLKPSIEEALSLVNQQR